MGFREYISGAVLLRLTCADVCKALQALTDSNLILLHTEMESELSVLVTLSFGDYKKAVKVLKKYGAKCELLSHRGLPSMLLNLKNRVIILAGCLILIILTLWLPSRIFFWDVSGNISLPDNYIISLAQEEGLTFGCKRADIRNDKFKNQLLARIPQLEWIGITTSGCVATISVSESQPQPEPFDDENAMGNIIAVCDGIVNSVTATKGNPICKPGQAVQKGEILISGYQDLGLVLRHSGAAGEVYASTYRVIEGSTLVSGEERAAFQMVSKKISLQIGKKLIKFSKDSGISHTSCVKMYKERYITLPGDFRLPISWVVETQYIYEMTDHILSEADCDWLEGAVKTYLQNQMLAGTILYGDLSLEQTDNACRFTAAYGCHEQIGINIIEEILHDGKNS